MRFPLTLLIVLLLTACATSGTPKKKAVHPVAMQAQFDLYCPRPEIRYMKLGEGHWGAVGCNKRARYRRLCDQKVEPNFSPHHFEIYDECRWVLDSPVQAQEARPAPQPSQLPSEAL